MTDLDKIELGLSAFFSGVYVEDVAVEGVEEVNTGWEARVIGFRLSVDGMETPMIARVFTGASASLKAEREFGVMLRLFRAGYPVPEVYAYSSSPEFIGEPFLVLEKLRGSLLDHFTENTKEAGKSLYIFSQLYAGLHSLPARKILRTKYSYRTTHGRLSHRVTNISRGLHKGSQLELIGEWLLDKRISVQNIPLTLLHQDFHPGNILFKVDGSPAVIDWSGADLGDLREDLGWTKLLASTFMSLKLGDAILRGYEEVSGKEIKELDYFEVLAGFRRLADAAIVLTGGDLGMREEVKKIMCRNRPHYEKIIARLGDLTGLGTSELVAIFD